MSWKDRLANFVSTPVRLAGSALYAGIDLLKTGISLGKDAKKIAMNTVDDIQGLFQEAGKRGHMLHKAANVPVLAPVGSVGKVGEGSVRVVINTAVNGVKNLFNTGKGAVQNLWSTATKIFSKDPISKFEFKHLSTANVWQNWDFRKMLIGAGIAGSVAATAPQVQAASDPTAVVAEASKSIDQENKHIDSLTKELDAQKQSNKQLDDKISQLVKQSEEQNKLMQQQLKQKDDMIAALQKSHGEKNNNEKDSNDESPKKKASKNKQLT